MESLLTGALAIALIYTVYVSYLIMGKEIMANKASGPEKLFTVRVNVDIGRDDLTLLAAITGRTSMTRFDVSRVVQKAVEDRMQRIRNLGADALAKMQDDALTPQQRRILHQAKQEAALRIETEARARMEEEGLLDPVTDEEGKVVELRQVKKGGPDGSGTEA